MDRFCVWDRWCVVYFSLPYMGLTVETHFRPCCVPATLFAIVSLRGVGVVGKGGKSSGRGGSLE